MAPIYMTYIQGRFPEKNKGMILLTSVTLTGRVALTEQACPCSLLFIHYGTCREESHSTRMPASLPQD